MHSVTVEEASSQIDALVEMAFNGEAVVIIKDGKCKVKLVPVHAPKGGRRQFGKYKGMIRISDDFDDPLPDEFWIGKTFPEHAERQGSSPVPDVQSLKAEFWPEEESVEDFIHFTYGQRQQDRDSG